MLSPETRRPTTTGLEKKSSLVAPPSRNSMEASPQELKVVTSEPELDSRSGERPRVHDFRNFQGAFDSQPSVIRVSRAILVPQAEQEQDSAQSYPSSISVRVLQELEEGFAVADTVIHQRTSEIKVAPPITSMVTSMTPPKVRQTNRSPAPVREDMDDRQVVAKRVSHKTARFPNQTASRSTLESGLQQTAAKPSRAKAAKESTQSTGSLKADLPNDPATTRIVTQSPSHRNMVSKRVQLVENELQPRFAPMNSVLTEPPALLFDYDLEEEILSEQDASEPSRKSVSREADNQFDLRGSILAPLTRHATACQQAEETPSLGPTTASIRNPVEKKQALQSVETGLSLEDHPQHTVAKKRTLKGEALSVLPNAPLAAGRTSVRDTESEAEPRESEHIPSAVSRAVDVPTRTQDFASDARDHYAPAKPGLSFLKARSVQAEQIALPHADDSYTVTSSTIARHNEPPKERIQAQNQDSEEINTTSIAEKRSRPHVEVEPVSKDVRRQATIDPVLSHPRRTKKTSISAQEQSSSHTTPAIFARRSATGPDSTIPEIGQPTILQYMLDHPVSPIRRSVPRSPKQQRRSFAEPEMVPLAPSRQSTRQSTEQRVRLLPRSHQSRKGSEDITGRGSSGFVQRMVVHDLEEDDPVVERRTPKHRVNLYPQDSSSYEDASKKLPPHPTRAMTSKSGRAAKRYSTQSGFLSELQAVPKEYKSLSIDTYSDLTSGDRHTSIPTEISSQRRKSRSDVSKISSRTAAKHWALGAEGRRILYSEPEDDAYFEDPPVFLESHAEDEIMVSNSRRSIPGRNLTSLTASTTASRISQQAVSKRQMRDHASASRKLSRKRSRVSTGPAKPITRMRKIHEREEPRPHGGISSCLNSKFKDTKHFHYRRWSAVAMRPAEDAVSEMSPSRPAAACQKPRPPRQYIDTLRFADIRPSASTHSTAKLSRSSVREPTCQRNPVRGTSVAFKFRERTASQQPPLSMRRNPRQSTLTARQSKAQEWPTPPKMPSN
jgi:hypothetical protein